MIDHFNPAGVGARARIEQRACSAHESVAARTVEPEISREAKMGERIPTPGPTLSGRAVLDRARGKPVQRPRRQSRRQCRCCSPQHPGIGQGLPRPHQASPTCAHDEARRLLQGTWPHNRSTGVWVSPYERHCGKSKQERDGAHICCPQYPQPGNSVCVSLDERPLIPCASFAGARTGGADSSR
jgi:hypothetical protein